MQAEFRSVEVLFERGRTRVERAVRVRDGRPVVLKIIADASPADAARLRHELAIIQQVASRRVVTAHAVVTLDRARALVLDDVQGRSLAVRAPTDPLDRLRVAIAATAALEDVHAAGVIHGEIEPGNIVVGDDLADVKLVDFGGALGRSRPPETRERELAYVAPEQTGRANRAVDHRSDLYSLGVTLYELFSGRRPFEVDDPLELVHCHLAQAPRTPRLDARLPEQLADVILKLLAKHAEGRYQSARGLRHDLERCLALAAAPRPHAPFVLGESDAVEALASSERLYGRDRELAIIAAAIERGSGLVLVEGSAGMGKTAVAKHVRAAASAKRAYVVFGAFSQADRHDAHAALAAAFRDLARAILGESDAQLSEWRELLTAALGGNGGVLVDMVPELLHVLGKQHPVPKLAAFEALSRLEWVVSTFIDAVVQIAQPLVIVLDDLHLAHLQALRLLEKLLTETSRRNLIVIATARGEPVDQQRLRRLFDAVPPARLTLGPLGRDDVAALCADLLSSEPAVVAPLADAVLAKTSGTPFFVDQFLRVVYDRALLRYDRGLGAWCWDLAGIEAATVTDNLADELAARLAAAPEPTRRALAVAACVGQAFALDTLAAVHDGDVAAALADAGELIARSPGPPATAEFRHARVRLAAYSLLTSEEAQQAHARIARHLETVEGADVFALAEHLNAAAPALDDAGALARCRRNLEAAQCAKASASYETARRYAQEAMDAIDTWAVDHALAAAIHKEAAEIEYLLGDTAAADGILDTMLDRATTELEVVDVLRHKIARLGILGDTKRAVASGRKALALLGWAIPGDIAAAVARELPDVEARLAGREMGWVMSQPDVVEPRIRAAMNILDALQAVTHHHDAELHAYVALAQVKLSLDHGISVHSISGYSSLFAAAWLQPERPYARLHELAMFGVALAERYQSPAHQARALLRLGACVSPWVERLATTLPVFDEGHSAAVASGELHGAGLNLQYKAINAWFLGRPLAEQVSELADGHRFAQRHGHAVVAAMIDAVAAPARYLTGDEDRGLDVAAVAATGWPGPIACFLVHAAEALYLAGHPEQALDYLRRAAPDLANLAGLVTNAAYNVTLSLATIARRGELTDEAWADAAARIARNQRDLAAWATSCPENFAHLHALVAAELARLAGDRLAAIDAYDAAIEGAARGGFLHHEALACELAGRFWSETGKVAHAAPLLRRAVQRYTRWGAARKAKQLAAAHGQLLDDASGGSALGGGDGARIDALVIIKASQAISEEVDLDALIQRLLGIVVQSTGAERGAIVLKDDAGAMVHRSDGRTLPLDERAELAATIVHYVLRTAKPLVLADAAIDSVYGRDPHVRRGAAKSVLCVPLIAHGKTGGAIYLEHGLVRDAFGHGRLQLLELLAAQAAISVDNARLYTTLVAKNRELERALELVEENVRLHKELEIGARIQTGILPTALDVPGLELAASMLTASEVGGDYYDILPRPDGAWIGIGDVAGHGLNAGVVMLMTQSAISTLGRERPDAQPSEILCVANELVFDNVRHRLRRDEHVTLSLLRYERNGRVVFAGAHEDILVHRARSGQCERVATPGTWLGLKRDIRSVTTDHELMLEQGDTLVLYTDGVIEAMSASREQFGLPRLSSIVEEHARDGSAAIRDRIVAELARWSPTRADDMTIVVARHG